MYIFVRRKYYGQNLHFIPVCTTTYYVFTFHISIDDGGVVMDIKIWTFNGSVGLPLCRSEFDKKSPHLGFLGHSFPLIIVSLAMITSLSYYHRNGLDDVKHLIGTFLVLGSAEDISPTVPPEWRYVAWAVSYLTKICQIRMAREPTMLEKAILFLLNFDSRCDWHPAYPASKHFPWKTCSW